MSLGRAAVLGILLILTLAGYWNSFTVPMVFDDLVTIQRNSQARFGEFTWNFLSARPLLYSTFTLNYLWGGQQVWGYHLVSVLLHLLNGLLIFAVAERIFRRVESVQQHSRMYALLAAAFFLIHPVQTESVTYISSRSELLSTFFYLAGFLIFVSWPEYRIGFLCSLAVAIAYFLGLSSKETVITLPATIFLYDFLFLSGASLRPLLSRWRFYVTYIVGGSAAIYVILTFTQRTTLGAALPGNLTSSSYLLTQFRVIVRYIQLVSFPVALNLDHDVKPSISFLEPAVITSFLFLSGVLLLGWLLRRRAPIFAFSIFWFFITLSPTSSIVPIGDVIFEHRLYLPLAGVCLSFPLLVELGCGRLRHRFAVPGTALAFSCLILGAFLVGTVGRNRIWGNEVRLFEDVLQKSPEKVRAYNALAWALYKQADYPRAINVLETGVAKLPQNYPELADTLSTLYLKTGRYDDAIKAFNKMLPYLRNDPGVTTDRLALEYNNIGMAYLYKWNDLKARTSQFTEDEFAVEKEQILRPAAEAFQTALTIHADLPFVLDSYINVSCYRGRGGEIEAHASERLKKKESFEDLYTIGKVAFNNGDYVKADEYFERAEGLRKDEKLVFFNHGYVLTMLKQDDRAIEKYVRAIYLSPIFIEAHFNLGQLYVRRREYTKAIEGFAEVLRQDPKHIGSNLNLAYIYMSQGNKQLARSHLTTVLEESPGNPQAMRMLQQLGL